MVKRMSNFRVKQKTTYGGPFLGREWYLNKKELAMKFLTYDSVP